MHLWYVGVVWQEKCNDVQQVGWCSHTRKMWFVLEFVYDTNWYHWPHTTKGASTITKGGDSTLDIYHNTFISRPNKSHQTMGSKCLWDMTGTSTHFLSPCYDRMATKRNPVGRDQYRVLSLMVQIFSSKGSNIYQENEKYYIWPSKIILQGY